jgi:acyl transferase domain-containing protein/phosphopantetheinyl transferase
MSGSSRREEPIAIVGMSCLFPGAEGPTQFWENVVGKVDAVSDPPPDWQPELFLDPSGLTADRAYTGRGGYLGDLCRFDPVRFRVMPSSVDGGEPDQFIALRCAHEAVEDAELCGVALNKDKTGVILGRGTFVNRGYVSLHEHAFFADQTVSVLRQLDLGFTEEELLEIRRELKRNLPPLGPETVPGLSHSVIVGRIANRLDLHGPAYTLDAACASSLLAVEQAIQELRSGRCDAMIAGGVQVSTPAIIAVMFCHLEALSRTGSISPFGEQANGTLLGEGCGMVVLKRVSDALRDGNRIYALLRAVGVSSDGKGAGILAPRQEGQELSIVRAYESSGISPSSIGLIEAHGTGIPLGDATELRSLAATFGSHLGGRRVALGSVKSMISHLIPAAGIAALIKTALALYHRVLPPTLHADRPNPELSLASSPFYLSTEARPWIHGDAESPRRAGVNAFGFGGINTHAILEEHETRESDLVRFQRRWPVEVVVVSAEDRERLREKVLGLGVWTRSASGASLLDIAASASSEPGSCRVAICARSVSELADKLELTAKLLGEVGRDRIQVRSGVFWYAEPLGRAGKLGFVFPGEGAQYLNMLSELSLHFPEVRHQFDLTERALAGVESRVPPSRAIFPPPDEAAAAEEKIFDAAVAAEAVATANRALLALVRALGIKPQAVVGHSSGEFGALLAARAIELASDVEVVDAVRRGGFANERIAAPGLVASAVLTTVGGASPEAVAAVVSETEGLQIAMDNCPHQVVLVGGEEATARAVARLQSLGALCARLPWDRPYHTARFAPACEVLEAYYAGFPIRTPDVELWSCATATPYPEAATAIRELAVRQWRSKVRFRETIEAMHDSGVRVFLEIGPRGNLTAFIDDALSGRPHAAVALDLQRKSGIEQLCRAVAMLVAHGVPVDLAALYRRRQPKLLDLSAAPPTAAPRPPLLKKELPQLRIGEEVRRSLAGRRPSATPAVPGTIADPPSGSPSAREGAFRLQAFRDYQETMRRFLRTQEQVMTAAPGRRSKPPSERTSDETSKARPVPSVPAPGDTPRAEAVSAVPVTALTLPPTQPMDSMLLDIVSRRTGYPPDMLSWDARIEADLGIDSIKKVEIVAEFRRAILPEVTELPRDAAQKLGDAGTLRAVLDIVQGLLKVNGNGSDKGISSGSGSGNGHVVSGGTLEAAGGVRDLRTPWLDVVPGGNGASTLVAECELDSERHTFLKHHTFGRKVSHRHASLGALPVMPLAMTMELMAEAALALRKGFRVVGLRNVRALRWLAFDEPRRRLRLEAESLDAVSVRVVVREVSSNGGTRSTPIADGIVDLDVKVNPLPLVAWTVDAPSAPSWSDEELYRRGMFHGPAFQSLRSLDGFGDEGIRATLFATEPELLLPAEERGGGLALPVSIVDGVGQALGLWLGESDYAMAFPVGFASLRLGASRDAGPLDASIRVSQSTQSTPGLWTSDAEVRDRRGDVVLRIEGRRDRLLPVAQHIWRYRVAPHEIVFGRAVDPAELSLPQGLVLCELDDFRREFLLEDSAFWGLVLSRLALSETERAAYDERKGPKAAAVSWLLGRVVAKDAVRLLDPAPRMMADIEIVTDKLGRPRAVMGPGGRYGETAAVSVSHKGLDAVAVAADPRRFPGVGIDLEPMRALEPDLLEDAFAQEERGILEDAASEADEPRDAWYLSGWCAKESIGKALGLGVLGGPGNVHIDAVDVRRGRLSATLRGALHREVEQSRPELAGRSFDALVWRRRGNVLALCVLQASEGLDERSSEGAGV